MSACACCLRTPRNNYSHERVRAAVAINSSPFWLILMQPESCERASTGMIDRSVATVVVAHLDDVLERTITLFSLFLFSFAVFSFFFIFRSFVLLRKISLTATILDEAALFPRTDLFLSAAELHS